ncbi:hypothetical protein O0L34_g2002 [Tuta absoluta]|nr:hypothetical protein O0L34_g2002 [Tuta absoluta]
MQQPPAPPPQPPANGDAQPHLNGNAPQNGDLPPGLRMSQTDQEIVRLIGQHLISIGLERSAAAVMEESGLRLEHEAAARFRQHVLAGDWAKADHDLRALADLLAAHPAVPPRALLEIKFCVLEQKYLEHLEGGRALDALHVLRNELTPLGHDTARVHRLSALMMCASPAELQRRARWPGACPQARRDVLARVQQVTHTIQGYDAAGARHGARAPPQRAHDVRLARRAAAPRALARRLPASAPRRAGARAAGNTHNTGL